MLVVEQDDPPEHGPAVDLRLLDDALQRPLDVAQAGRRVVLHRHARGAVREEALEGSILPQSLEVAAALVEEVAAGGGGILEGVLVLRGERLPEAVLARVGHGEHEQDVADEDQPRRHRHQLEGRGLRLRAVRGSHR